MSSNAQTNQSTLRKLRIAFVHPDLGIGGAERLVVDAALGLQEKGHEVIIYTSHCDKNHCFEEVKSGVLKVEVMGDFWPTNISGKLFILFANLRQLYLTGKLALTGKIGKNDLYIVDQLSTCVPFIALLSQSSRVLFYCHFPDQLLARRTSLVKKAYRVPFDLLEQLTMNAADCIVVNSKFTRSVFAKTFRLATRKPNVVYPCVGLENEKTPDIDTTRFNFILAKDAKFYVSVNRFERKKNIELAIQAFALTSQSKKTDTKLVIAGGYDERVQENRDYLLELQQLSDKSGLDYVTLHYPQWEKCQQAIRKEISHVKIIFLTSISSSLKDLLLQKSEMLLYTPAFEHFGIVPLEAMKLGKPVLAVDNGGPLETVVSLSPGSNEKESTGWLRRGVPSEWAAALEESVTYLQESPTIFEQNGPTRVHDMFSREAMTEEFEKNISGLPWDTNRRTYAYRLTFLLLCMCSIAPVAYFAGVRSLPFTVTVAGLLYFFKGIDSFACIAATIIVSMIVAR
ncbi:LAFA_0G20692g1_1 [Lachancea sp. 'fantastica']|nr:LAFA_0G20692g1_1 [Lachancea sp. 'fantastica']